MVKCMCPVFLPSLSKLMTEAFNYIREMSMVGNNAAVAVS